MLHRLGRRSNPLHPPRQAAAHSGTHAYIYVKAEDGTISGSVQLPESQVAQAMGREVPPPEFESIRRELEDRVRSGVSIRDADGAQLPLDFLGLRTVSTKSGAYAALDYRIDGPAALPRRLTVDAAPWLDADHHRNVEVLTTTGVGWGRFNRTHRTHDHLSQQEPTAAVELREPSFGAHLAGTVRVALRRGAKQAVRSVRS